MKPFTLVLLCKVVFFLCGWQAKAQPRFQEEIDSLLIMLRTAPEDTNKVEIYGGLSWNYAGIRTETATARAYADSVRLLSEKLEYERGIIQSHLYYGACDRYEGNYADALAHFKVYVDYYKKIGNTRKEAPGWFQIGTVHQELGNYEQSMAAFEAILKIYENNEHWHGVAATLNSIGIIYKRTGKYGQAIESYQKAIAVNDSFNLNRDLTYVLLNTGNAYGELQEYDKEIEPENTYLPSMVLQPFVENAIWHGLLHKETEEIGMISIAIREDADYLLCTIEDNGVGREKARVLQEKSVLKSKSMGLKITEERLRLLSKEQLEQLIRITDLKDAMDFAQGTRVEINIPIS